MKNFRNYIIFLLLFNIPFHQILSANETDPEKYSIHFSELYKNRILLSFYNHHNPDIVSQNEQGAVTILNSIKTTSGDTTRIKWEYLGPFIGAVAVTNLSLYYIFRDAYWNEEKTKFHTFNDWNNADMNIDKIGHFYAGLLLTQTSYNVFRWTRVPEKQSVIFSTLSSIFFQTQVEIHDAYYKKWGWSWWDFSMNVVGAIFPHLQNYFSPLQAINLKWSYFPSPAYKKGWYDHWIKDYEGFTYYLTFDINSILPSKLDRFWPDWLNIAVAYGVDKVKLGKNIWNSSGKPLGDREWYIALDYSLLKIFNPKSQTLRDILKLIDNFHFPAPAVKISPNTIWYGLHF